MSRRPHGRAGCHLAGSPLSEEEIAKARRAILELARAKGRASAAAAHQLRIEVDMDDPQVARDVMMATFEGLFLSKPKSPARKRGATDGRDNRRLGGKAGSDG